MKQIGKELLENLTFKDDHINEIRNMRKTAMMLEEFWLGRDKMTHHSSLYHSQKLNDSNTNFGDPSTLSEKEKV